MDTKNKFWFKWVVNYSLKELLAVGVATTIGRLLYVEFSEAINRGPDFVVPLVLTVTGIAEGLSLGYLQWRSLSRLVTNFRKTPWILVTTIMMTIGWVVVIPPSMLLIAFFIDFHLADKYYSILYTLVAGVAFGGICGFGQFFVLKRYYSNAIIWLFSNAFSWMLSFLIVYVCLVFLGGSTGFLSNVFLLILASGCSGLVQGLITGFTLHYLMSVRDAYKYSVAT
jgi:hypothetical protein